MLTSERIGMTGPVEEQRATPAALGDPHPRPRWVKVSILIGLAIVVLAIIAAIAGGHGPGRHTGAVDPSAPAPVEIISPT